jgi:hypothetical protein
MTQNYTKWRPIELHCAIANNLLSTGDMIQWYDCVRQQFQGRESESLQAKWVLLFLINIEQLTRIYRHDETSVHTQVKILYSGKTFYTRVQHFILGYNILDSGTTFYT